LKGTDTKERLLRIGLDQASVRGLLGVTIGQLADASGMSKSGLFAHFRSKDQLQIDLLDETARSADRIVVEPVMQAAAGLPRLEKLFEVWFGWPARAGLSGGCPLAAAIFELDDAEHGVRDHAQKLEAHWRAFLSKLVGEAVAEGHLSKDTDIEQFVWELCGIYLSFLASSRFLRDDQASSHARHAFDNLVARHRREPDPVR